MINFIIRFITSNQFKIAEANEIMSRVDITVLPVEMKIEEIQTQDSVALVKDKALKAFKRVGRPLFVEHTGLYLSHLNGLPGGLTQVFWDTLQADRFSEVFGKVTDNSALAKTMIGYIDGKIFHTFEGAIEGTISDQPRGSRDFQWDCVFTPKGEGKTFAEIGDRKNQISMRRIALDKFANHLRREGKA